ncbi:MAG: hypothetical protein JJ896_16010 [Rhodothermales bacterium]|nr:hypothetical protein [Rhodothermales bacterium]MBO6781160.1 hypothetical protein [Rhodothermales bacterium]
MQFIIWAGIAVLGLITLSATGMVFFHAVGEFRKGKIAEPIAEPIRPASRRNHLRKVDLDALRDRPPVRRAA